MKVLFDRTFAPIETVKGDSITFTLTLFGKRYTHTHKCKKAQSVNTMKVLQYEEFEGMEEVFVFAVGHTK